MMARFGGTVCVLVPRKCEAGVFGVSFFRVEAELYLRKTSHGLLGFSRGICITIMDGNVVVRNLLRSSVYSVSGL